MEIVAYVAYGILVVLAVVWSIGVRTRLGAGTPIIFGTLYFVVSAVAVPVLGINMVHALWLVPLGFVATWLTGWMLIGLPAVVTFPIRLLAGTFSSIIRIGIPSEVVREAQDAAARAAVEECLRENGNS